MRRDLHADGDQRYRIGFVVEHNPDGRDRAGSCIFAHVWKAPGAATAGCTAMSDADMQQLLRWLDRRQSPRFVLLPAREYERLGEAWKLP
jgi:L,D-peptidoglycan transpeptidase YkuD (ErfK/YbiS/YcfS/YnhG family)